MKLKHPITIGKLTISELNFREYTTADDYLAFDKRGGVAQDIAFITSLTGTDEVLVKQLRGPDFRRAQKEVARLLAEDETFDPADDAPEKKPQES